MEKISLHTLSHLGFLHAEGADTDTFLQGQLSNDVQLLTAERAQLSSYNSPKGRMLAVLWLTRVRNGVLIELERSILDATLQRLRMFVLRSKVVLSDVSNSIAAIGVSGMESPQQLATLGLPAPLNPGDCAVHEGITVLRRHGSIPRFSLHGPVNKLETLRNTLALHIPYAEADAWTRLDILSGVPVVLPQTRDHFVPQMANLDLLDGISFKKGCYTGQEIVARLHYLGNLKRRLFHCRTDALEVAAGTGVYDAGHEQAIGEVVQSAHAHGGSLLSVVLQLSHAQSDQLRLGSPTGAALSKAHPHTASLPSTSSKTTPA
jgi:folate-binding protein YgfZ